MPSVWSVLNRYGALRHCPIVSRNIAPFPVLVESDRPSRGRGEVRISVRMRSAMEIYSEESFAARDEDEA